MRAPNDSALKYHPHIQPEGPYTKSMDLTLQVKINKHVAVREL